MIKKIVLIVTLVTGFIAVNALPVFATAPSNGSWVLTGDMTVGRTSFAITLLQNGKALVAEGDRADYNGPLIPYAELYDPTTGTWSQTGSLLMPRISTGENLVTLQNGKVLLAGGSDRTTSDAYTEAELYDPTTGTWSTTGSMNTPRRGAAYVLLNDGRVLAAAGNPNQGPGTPTNSAEIYDPASGTWSYTASLAVARDGPSMIKLQDGRVLIAGGEIPGNTCDNSPEIFDPTTSTWSSAGTMPYRWQGDSQLLLLPDGRVFAAGGYCNPFGSNVSNTAIYDPATNSWTATAPVPQAPVSIMFLLDNGKVMVRSGTPDGTTPPVMETYDPTTNTWTVGATLPFANSVRGVSLANGDELAAGDLVWDPTNSANVLPHTYIYKTVLTVSPITAPASPVLVNTSVTASASFTDSNTNPPTATWNWGDGSTSSCQPNSSACSLSESNGTGTLSGSHTYTASGVYTLTLKITDSTGASVSSTYQYIAVYNLSTSFAGGNSFDNPSGASPSTSGKVKFGVSANYSNNGSLTGKVKVDFNAANIDFASTSLQSLATSNGRAYLKGSGTLNGTSGYTFLITGIDGSVVGGNDLIRIQIKDSSGNVVYDSQPRASDTADPTTTVATGNIRIH